MPPIIGKGNCPLQPYWTTADGLSVKLYKGDVLEVLSKMPRRSVHTAISSPPYWGLRDYGTGEWEGGRADCNHLRFVGPRSHDATKPKDGYKSGFRGSVQLTDHRQEPWPKSLCGRCGARRIDSQLGSESVPDCLGWARGVNCADNDNGGNWQTGCHVCRMVLVFRLVRRILRDDGTLWLNYGSTYVSSPIASDQFTLRADITDKERRRAFTRIAEVLSSFEGESGGDVCEVRDKVSSLSKPTKSRDGKVLLSKLCEVGKSDKGTSTKGKVPNVRRSVQEIQCGSQEEQDEETLLQPGMLVQLESEGQPLPLDGGATRKDESGGGKVEKGGTQSRQKDLQKVSLDKETGSTPYSAVRTVPESKVGREQRNNSVQALPSSVSRAGDGTRGPVSKNSCGSGSIRDCGMTLHGSMIPPDIAHLFKPLWRLPQGNDAGIPWRVAFALQADGWILRSDIPWLKRCLSGGAIVYARTQKGDMPVMVKDLVRLRPETVQLWNGERWTQVKGFCETKPSQGPRSRQLASIMRRSGRSGAGLCGPTDLEIEFRSGERVACTRIHQWPTQRGVIQAKDLKVGDCVPSVRLPEPEEPLSPSLLDDKEIGWVVGFYIAEGCTTNEREVKFSVHTDEIAEFERIKVVTESLGDSCTFKRRGQTNGAVISVSGRLFAALMAEYVYGNDCYTKGLTTKAWQRSDRFLVGVAKGYLDGDGHSDESNDRWRIGFCNNDRLASDLRTLASRTNSRIRLRRCSHRLNDQLFPGWKGEWRFWTPCTDSTQGEIVAIRNARSRKFWDIEVADEPHTFALASGILTHNSAMPESTSNRPCKALEYVFLFAKQGGYYFDMEAVRKKATPAERVVTSKCGSYGQAVASGRKPSGNGVPGSVMRTGDKRNFRNADLWFESVKSPHGLTGVGDKLVGIDCTSEAYPGAHYATFPGKLITPFILAGTSEYGCCANCGTPWRRVVEKSGGTTGKSWHPHLDDETTGNTASNLKGKGGHNYRVDSLGWEQACGCDTEEVVPCTVLDPFIGSGTTAAVALEHGRYAIGIELKEEYLRKNAIPRIEGVCFARPELRHLVKREVKRVDLKGKKA